MPRTAMIEKTYYKFEELSDSAKEKAIQEWLEGEEYPWHGENCDSLKEFCEYFNLSGLEYEYGMVRYSYAKAEIEAYNYNYDDIAELSGIRLWKYLNNNYDLDKLLNGDCPFTGYYIDESLLDAIRGFIKNPVTSMTFQELINECLSNWASAVVHDMEGYFSEENAIESILANGYEFYGNGEML